MIDYRAVAQFVIDHPGCTIADISRFAGVSPHNGQPIIHTLTFYCYLWSETIKGKERYYCDYIFDARVGEGCTDLWTAMFGKPLVFQKRDPSVLTQTALEEEMPWIDWKAWRIQPTGFMERRLNSINRGRLQRNGERV